jgi:1-acyl-sn-glycerol-3-phosphate acyltransferase
MLYSIVTFSQKFDNVERLDMIKAISVIYFAFFGWKLFGKAPEARKYVLIAAPHTSNWDFLYLKLSAEILDIRLQWMGKHTLFKGILGYFTRRMGGIPVDRRGRNNVVDQMVKRFESDNRIVLTIPPEGTRSYVDYWKSGFYSIAKKANVPIVLSKLDYRRKRAEIGKIIFPVGNVSEVMNQLRDYYKDTCAKFPDQFGRIRLKEEDDVEEEKE